jgi:hypothetical protein
VHRTESVFELAIVKAALGMEARQQKHYNKNTRHRRQSVVRDFAYEIGRKKVLDHDPLLEKCFMPSLLH